jgi:CheY-like chemotaxis protein
MKRVLIVDDAIDLGRLLQDALKVSRPETPITVVPSAEEALLEATRFKFDLLVTDLRLPGMSGLELIRKIRGRQPDIKVILITALMPEDRLVRQKDEVHPDIFIRKPLSVMTFLDAVDSLIGAPEEDLPPPLAEADVAKEEKSVEEAVAAASEALPAEETQISTLFSGEEKHEKGAVSPATIQPPEEKQPEQSAAQVPNEQNMQDLLKELDEVFPGVPVETPVQARKPSAQAEAVIAGDGISGTLTRLRGTLGAFAAILFNESGHPVAQAGDLPDLLRQEPLIPAVLAALSTGAKVSHLLGSASTGSVQAYRGKEFDLVLVPVGHHTLVIPLNTGRSALRFPLAIEEALQAQQDLAIALEVIGVEEQPKIEVISLQEMQARKAVTRNFAEDEILADLQNSLLGQDPNLDKFESLVTERQTGQIQITDPDQFWESASGGEGGGPGSPDVLSYEQAQKLGLFKDNPEK